MGSLLKRIAVIIIGAIFLTGCGTTIKVTKLNSPQKHLSPRTPDSVEVYITGRPSVPYTEVSLISSQQASDLSTDDTPEIIQEMRTEAANQGCDALVITMANNNVSGATVGSSHGVYGSVDTLKGFHGTCVVYKN
jgi:PBP1b-binding outer membrane lipoprotein LpoB